VFLFGSILVGYVIGGPLLKFFGHTNNYLFIGALFLSATVFAYLIPNIPTSVKIGFTQKGGLTVVPNEIRVFNIKIDDEFYPDELKASWLGFLTAHKVSRTEWPLVKYLMENYYKKQIDRDMEMDEYYKGTFAAPTHF